MALYEESLATKKALNEPRSIAVTQGRIADLLVKMGQPKEAMALYEESLATKKALNEPREIAVTQANYAQVLLLNDEPGRAIQMLWAAYLGICQVAFRPDIEGMQQLLVGAKTHLGSDRFDALWHAHIQQAQPEWLQHALDSPNDTSSASDPAPANLLGEQLNTVVNNTVAVMTVATDQREQWWQAVTEANTRARAAGVSAIATFNDAVLALLEGSQPELPADNPHYAAWQQILAGIAAGGLPTQLVQPSNAPTQDTDAAAIVQAISAFVNSEDWDAGQQIVQAQSVLLFRPEVAQIFEQNITQARTAGNDDWAKTLRTHLQVLQAAQQHGIAETFAQLKGSAAPQPSEEPDPVDDALLETLTNNTAAVLGPVVDRRSQWRGQLVSLRNAGVAQGRSDFVALLDAHLALLDAEGDPTGLGVGLVDRYAVAWQQLCAILADDSG